MKNLRTKHILVVNVVEIASVITMTTYNETNIFQWRAVLFDNVLKTKCWFRIGILNPICLLYIPFHLTLDLICM